MDSHAGNNYTTPGGNYTSIGLEGGFDSLTLNSPSGPGNQHQGFAREQPVYATSNQPMPVPPQGFAPGPIQPPETQSTGSFQQNAPARRRLNQAQRRQMSSQLSIPVDTRPVHSSFNWRGYGHGPNPGGPNVSLPRHQHTMSHPHFSPFMSRSSQQHLAAWNNGVAEPAAGNPAPHTRLYHQPQPHRDGHFENRPRHNSSIHGNQNSRPPISQDQIFNQTVLLDNLCMETLASSEINRSEIAEKETFRHRLEAICRHVITQHEWDTNASPEFSPPSVELKCFGSLSSGFATKASDMDLGLLSPASGLQPDAPGSPIPRLIEKALLDAGVGARLLSRTRVPIIKLCESPPENLLRDLRAQRKKWEAGLDQGNNESNDEDDAAGDPNVDVKDEESKQQPQEDCNSADFTAFLVPDEHGQLHKFHIRQTSKHNLASYGAFAKRVLRRAGGRDVTLSNWREFTPHDWAVLNLVCRAFVHGLADAALRQNLLKYPSLAFEPDSGISLNRSLLGVSVQIEGEQIIQLWKNWPMSGLLAASDPMVGQCIDFWHNLQCKQNCGEDPISYTKELQLALDRLKRLPSFQLLLFEQSNQESVTQYHERMLTIIKHLRVPRLERFEGIHGESFETANKYIAGICYESVRDDIKLWQSATGIWDLGLISCKHRCLQLATDLERALNKGLYHDATADDVRRCIEVLRGPLREVVGPSGSRAFVVSLDDEEADDLFSRIGFISDPHKVSPNQPHDRYRDPLEFPKHDAGVQCDINFSAHLALENTALLRCYASTDQRVRPMVLFIKHWAKVRGINSGYRGTLSSYGYVLMVLHYLVNVASPFVCPNLQQKGLPMEPAMCKGYNVTFWRDEEAITQLASSHQINQNSQTLGYLLRGFFEYFAQNGLLTTVPGRGFDWGRDVLSLRSPGGLLTKQAKGWTGAKTVYQPQGPNEPSVKPPTNPTDSASGGAAPDQARTALKNTAVKEIRLRYLFAIEDPFEVDHNVARTVTHNGIVSIRDEFRRAWRIIQAAGKGFPHDNLLEDVDPEGAKFRRSLYEVHGWTMAQRASG